MPEVPKVPSGPPASTLDAAVPPSTTAEPTPPVTTAEPTPPVADSGADAATPQLGDFSEPVSINELNIDGYEVDDPSLTGDGLEIFLGAEREPNVGSLWTSRRESLTAAWEAPRELTELGEGGTPWVLPDGLSIYFASFRDGGQGGLDIWRATRTSREAEWDTPAAVPVLNSKDFDAAPAVAWSGLSLTMTRRTEADVSSRDIFVSTRASEADPWSQPVVVMLFEPNVEEADPFLSNDELTLYFASMSNSSPHDLFFATRTSASEPFANVTPLASLNSDGSDEDPWVSEDGREIYFSSNRGGRFGIFRATR